MSGKDRTQADGGDPDHCDKPGFDAIGQPAQGLLSVPSRRAMPLTRMSTSATESTPTVRW
jgi:hypothetical protein